MPEDPRLRQLLERLVEEQGTPEEVCADAPELLPEVRARWQRMHALIAEVDALFPLDAAAAADAAEQPARTPIVPKIPGYAIENVLGRGGMGIVYRARQLRLDRTVALKMLLVGAHATPQEIARFQREAEVVAALRHPNIVRVFDSGECEGWPYLVMEFVDGGTLADKLATMRMDARAAASLIATLAAAVDSAHRCGVVHRDLKPGNVLLAADGTPKISDFGLARRLDRAASLTFSGTVLGTPSYMAPEQAMGRTAVGPPADIYSLGAILYELLAGRPPVQGDTPAAAQRQLLTQDPVPPSRHHAKVPRDLETICLKCLHREPARRYATAAALTADLQRFLQHEPIHARRVGRVERIVRWAQRTPAGAALLLLAVLLLLSGAAMLVRNVSLAAELDARSALWRPKLGDAIEQLRSGRDLRLTQDLLEQIPGDLASDLEQQRAQAQRDLILVGKLDEIRLGRATVAEGRLDTQRNRAQADAAYAEQFRRAGLGVAGDAPEAVAARVRAANVARPLVAALDDWALCTADPARRAWVLAVARSADPDPDGWRDRVRDPSACESADALQQLTRDAPLAGQSAQILVSLGERMRDAGIDAVPFLGKVQQLHPSDFWVNFLLGDILGKRRSAEAIRYFQAALALRPRSPAAWLGLGRALTYAGKPAEAMAAFQTAKQLDPSYAQALMSLGTALANLKLSDDAIRELERAVELEPTSSSNHFNLGAVLIHKGEYQRATRELNEAIRIAPRDVNAHVELGRALIGLERKQEAIAEYELALRLDPRSAWAHENYGDLLRHDGRFSEAIVEFREAVRLEPEKAWSQLALANCLSKAGRHEEALAPGARAVELEPDSTWHRNQYGDCLLQLGRRAEAIEQYRAALAIDPDDGGAGWRLPLALAQAGSGEEACAVSAHASATRPQQNDFWDSHAILCLYVGRVDDWRSACAQMLDQSESVDDPRVWERTGRDCLLAACAPEVRARATALIDRAIAADPARYPAWAMPYFQFAKALAEYRADRFEAAGELLRGGAALAFGPAPRLLLAMALQRAGQTTAAQRALATAALEFEWGPGKATRDAWMYHVLRREAEATVAPELPELLAGHEQPADDDARAILFGASRAARQNATAAQLCAALMASDQDLGKVARAHRYLAASAAAAAGTGDDATTRSDAEQAACRQLALQWLGAELEEWESQIDAASPDRLRELGATLMTWRTDPELAGLREPQGQRQLAVAERAACLALWERAAALQARIDTRQAR